MTVVYIVTNDDFPIMGVFSTRELAQALIDASPSGKYFHYDIEEWIVDEFAPSATDRESKMGHLTN